MFSTFVCGVSTMAIEMSASRLLAPWFGTSMAVWTNIIGVMMLALCSGYWLGGVLADRYPRPGPFCALICCAGLLAFLIPPVSPALLGFLCNTWSMEEFSGSFLATALIFAPPIFALGMVNPFAIRLCTSDVGGVGALSGRVYALSTIGSLVGTFLPVLLTIPLLGARLTVFLFALALLATSASLPLLSRL